MLLRAYNGGVVDANEELAAALLNAGWKHVVPETGADLSGLTVAQLRDKCAERGIDAPKRATKAQLMELLTE